MRYNPNQREIVVATGEEMNENVMLNPDYYTHKLIDKIIEAPEKNPNIMIMYVDMLEKLLVSRNLMDEDKKKEIDVQVKKEMALIKKKLPNIDKRAIIVMRYNVKFQFLLEIVFSARPLEDVVRI